MFELHFTADGQKYLKWVDRRRFPGERGLWVDIGKATDRGINQIIEINRSHGIEVEIDDRNTYRALVLKD